MEAVVAPIARKLCAEARKTDRQEDEDGHIIELLSILLSPFSFIPLHIKLYFLFAGMYARFFGYVV